MDGKVCAQHRQMIRSDFNLCAFVIKCLTNSKIAIPCLKMNNSVILKRKDYNVSILKARQGVD